MIEHIVLFKWTVAATTEQIAAVAAELRGLGEKIPGILDLVVGDNFSERAEGFQFGLVVRFTDRAALENYGPHPAHQRVVQEFINPIRDQALVVDFEIGG